MSQNKQTFVKKAGFAEARATKKVAKIRAEKKAMKYGLMTFVTRWDEDEDNEGDNWNV